MCAGGSRRRRRADQSTIPRSRPGSARLHDPSGRAAAARPARRRSSGRAAASHSWCGCPRPLNGRFAAPEARPADAGTRYAREEVSAGPLVAHRTDRSPGAPTRVDRFARRAALRDRRAEQRPGRRLGVRRRCWLRDRRARGRAGGRAGVAGRLPNRRRGGASPINGPRPAASSSPSSLSTSRTSRRSALRYRWRSGARASQRAASPSSARHRRLRRAGARSRRRSSTCSHRTAPCTPHRCGPTTSARVPLRTCASSPSGASPRRRAPPLPGVPGPALGAGVVRRAAFPAHQRGGIRRRQGSFRCAELRARDLQCRRPPSGARGARRRWGLR